MKTKTLASRLFDSYSANQRETERAAGYHRQVDCKEEHETAQVENATKKTRGHREIHLAFLPETYEPLVEEDEAREKAKEEKKNKKKATYKKVRKNVGKAFRYSWKCLILGLHSFTAGYSTPISSAANLVTDFHVGKNKT